MKEQDEKLTAEQREKLPASAFCGPNRSFPAHDCEHVRAGLSLLGRYKGPGSKSEIRKCLYAKALKLKCFKSQQRKNGDSASFGTIETIRELYILCADGYISNIAEGIALLTQLCMMSNPNALLDVIGRAHEKSLLDGFEYLISTLVE